MKLPIFLIIIISTAWAQTRNIERPVRAPQKQIKFDEIDDSQVNWKYIIPENQWQLQPTNAQRSQRADGRSSHHLRQQTAPQHRAPASQSQSQQIQQIQTPQYYSYKPYSAVPNHIKQLINSVYQPQAPYVDPASFLYNSGYTSPQQPAPAASEIPRTAYFQPSAAYQTLDSERYNDRVERQDRIVYKENYEQPQEEQQQEEQQQEEQQQKEQQVATLPIGTLPDPPAPTLYLDKNMPSEIKQLLQYQAQIPYDVTANRIQYRPKNIFIPKPLPEEVKEPNYYRSKVYYTNDDNVDAEYSQDKPIDENDQRH